MIMRAVLRRGAVALIGASLASSLVGCGNFFSVYRRPALDRHSIAIDAEQRIVMSGSISIQDPQSRQLVTRRIICAEPSPDVLKVRGGNFSALLDRQGQKDIQAALNASEAGQSIGLRTQSIQLLRDAMYRLCEGALAGMVEPEQFVELQTRFQKLTAVLLATEQLTGAVQPRPTPVIAVVGGANTGSGLIEIQKSLEAAKKSEAEEKTKNDSLTAEAATLKADVDKAAAAKTAAEDAKKGAEGAGNAAEAAKQQGIINEQTTLLADKSPKLEKKKAELTESTERLAGLTADREALERQREAARSASGSTGAFAVMPVSDRRHGPLDPTSVQYISSAVKGMVTEVFAQDSQVMVCLRSSLELIRKEEELVRLSAQERQLSDMKPILGGNDAEAQSKALQSLEIPAVTGAWVGQLASGKALTARQLDEAASTLRAARALADLAVRRLQSQDDYCQKVFEVAGAGLKSPEIQRTSSAGSP